MISTSMMFVKNVQKIHKKAVTFLPIRSFILNQSKLARFTRTGLAQRLKVQRTGEFIKPGNLSDKLPDQIPLRPKSHHWRTLGFLSLIGAGAYTCASIMEFKRFKNMRVQYGDPDSFFGISDDLMNKFDSYWAQYFGSESSLRNLRYSEKLLGTIVGLNVCVFVAWRIQRLRNFMYRYFTSSFASRSLCLPTLLCVFSHYGLIHLMVNMYVLQSFAVPTIDKFLGPEQFAAFYIVGGVFASVISLLHKSFARLPVRGLGASGAILAVLVYACMRMPESRLSIVFFPWFTFSAEKAVYGIIIFDLLGLLGKFQLFDHAAHLAGSGFGLFYALYGEQWYRAYFQPAVISLYYRLTGNGTKTNRVKDKKKR